MIRFAVALAVVAVALAPGSASAQLDVGLVAGPSYPVGSLGDVVDPGYHVGIAADIGVPLVPLGLRGDVTFQNLPGKGDTDSYRQVAAIASGRIGVSPLPLLGPYFIAGIGLYASSFDENSDSQAWRSDVGVNAGLGAQIRLLLIEPFIEVRYHRLFSGAGRSFVPIGIGIFF